MNNQKVKKAVTDILWMARRYANGRQTYAPHMFNDAYDVLRKELGDEIDDNISVDQDNNNAAYDVTIPSTKFHPYAVDGNKRIASQLKNEERPYYLPPKIK